MVAFSICARKSLDEFAQPGVCVWTLQISNADVMRDLFAQHMMADFVDMAEKGRQVGFVCPKIYLWRRKVNRWSVIERSDDGPQWKWCPSSLSWALGSHARLLIDMLKLLK